MWCKVGYILLLLAQLFLYRQRDHTRRRHSRSFIKRRHFNIALCFLDVRIWAQNTPHTIHLWVCVLSSSHHQTKTTRSAAGYLHAQIFRSCSRYNLMFTLDKIVLFCSPLYAPHRATVATLINDRTLTPKRAPRPRPTW